LEVQADLYASYAEKCQFVLKKYNMDKDGICKKLIEARDSLKNTKKTELCTDQERHEYYLNNKNKARKYIYDITEGETAVKLYYQFYNIEQ